jgi:hypothetical protein
LNLPVLLGNELLNGNARKNMATDCQDPQ